MPEPKQAKRLQLHAETLKQVGAGAALVGFSGPGCTVWTTCSPTCRC